MGNIKMQTVRWFLFLTLAVLISSLALAQGQSTTLLPDGNTLILGGLDLHSLPTNAALITSPAGTARKLGGMIFPRAGHTGTVLPDGTVFIFGGIGSDGQIVATAELFDPATQEFSILADVLAVPRAFHSATLLTDGTVLLAGGIMAGGQFPDDVQLWDFRSKRALSQHASLLLPREGHVGTLLSDGSVRISGGKDHFGQPAQVDEIYDPITKRFRFANSSDSQNALPFGVSASIPVDGATDVAVESFIAFRFTQLANVLTATDKNFILTAPNGSVVPAKVSAAERGKLVFVLPATSLEPGTNYSLRLTNVTDASGESLSDTSISFQTKGEPPDSPGLDWTPNSTWSDNTGITKFLDLPPLQASPNETALAGQVLKLSGWPLRHVTLEIDKQKVRTDSTGRFLLKGLTPGHHVLWIDGSTANGPNATYGVYPVGVTILPNKTNVLNYTVWMTRLDIANAVNIPSPTTKETVVTTPNLPGVELHLPANTVIKDRFGKVVRQVTITPVPLNKPPFPLPPGVQLPVFFVVQPGGAQIEVLDTGSGPDGAQLVYPNRLKLKPGTPFAFWNYDPLVKGWYIYGQGAASADGSSLVPGPGVEIYTFTAAGTGPVVGNPSGASMQTCMAGQTACGAADPVSLATGQFTYSKTDLALPDTIPIEFTRTYMSNDNQSRAFGIGATHSYNIFLVGDGSDSDPYTYQELILPNGARIRFDRISTGTSFSNAVYVHVSSKTPFYGARISYVANPSSWLLTLKNGATYTFPVYQKFSTNPSCEGPSQISDVNGNTINLTRVAPFSNAATGCELTTITSSNGRSISLTYDTQGRITQAVDNIGRTVLYSYDAAGRLSTVTDAAGGVTTYTYDDQNRMLTIKDPRNIVYLTNHYDAAGRVDQQTAIDTGTYLFNWTPTVNPSQARFYSVDPNPGAVGGSAILRNGCWNGSSLNRYSASCGQGYMPLVAQVDITDPRGYVRRVVFGSGGYPTSDTHALGQPEQQTVTYAYYADNTLQSVTDALGRVTSFDYDGLGNTTRVTRLDGTSDAVTTTFSYEPTFNQLASVTDPLNHSTTFAYDGNGNLSTVTDALSHPTSFAYNGAGQVTSITDALNNTVQLNYFGGDLVSVTDPVGNSSSSIFDGAGRVTSTTDPQGNTARYQYNNLNLVTQVTDPKGNNTTFSYDPNGNLLSLTDALHLTTPTTWTYDNMDRVLTRTDPLLRQESYSYDLMGNLVSSTDRKNQVTSLTYDPLNRLKLVGYNTIVNAGVTSYESTVGYTYDAGNRMTQAVDSAGGTITEAYDNLDRLTSETTPQGQISYGYDLAGRRANMTVAGQPQVTYSYDNANRLTQIAQGTSTVGFSYDTANRRSTLTLSNGVNMSYTYDNDSRVTGITYKFSANTLGNLTYSYDSLGRRTQVGGSFAQTGLPGTVTSATYDAANELTNWNGTPISYDLNGNMLSDGANTFSWNARNQVATLNSVSLQYDGFGRRTKNLQNTTFLFDGANGVQELSGSTATANLISGGIDEIFTRADSTGTYTPLKDALGSTMALVDASGNLVTQYAYDPFGNTTVSGATNSNALQYTGRENEGNGLYFYRARYYSPCTGRFISEDPLGFGGGDENLYGYVFDNPTNLSDPSGMQTGNSGSGNGSGNAPSLAGRYFSPEQCAAIQEILRRERKYGTAIAAIKSGVSSPFSDGLLGVFNSTYVPDFETPLGIMNLDWFTDLEATSLADLGPPFFPYMNIPFIRYGWAKTAWIGIRALHFPDAPPVTNYVPYSSPGETNAAWQATKPWIGYRDIFTPEFVRRKCPPR
jgi:RHS repeat-associated protein